MSSVDTRPQVARVSTFLRVEPDVAFSVFTEETDAWWRRGMRFRGSPRGVVRFEGGANGRLLEEDGDDVFEIGRVLRWEPGAWLSFEWRGRNFAPGEVTRVDVCFEPVPGGTRVLLEHHGWETLRPDHPVRHAKPISDFLAMMGLWWADQATTWRLLAERSHPSPP